MADRERIKEILSTIHHLRKYIRDLQFDIEILKEELVNEHKQNIYKDGGPGFNPITDGDTDILDD